MKIEKNKIFQSLPQEKKIIFPENIHLEGKSVIVIDDDPTGCQTIHDVDLLFSWEKELIAEKLNEKPVILFILANTRSMDRSDAIECVREICRNIKYASEKTGQDFIIISRSDSTLRGHFPQETDIIAEELNTENPLFCLIPAFFQGGRFTIDDTHYVQEGEYLIPAAETPFAEDKSFGFNSSNLFDYIIEKTENKICREEIISFSLADLRMGSSDNIVLKLNELSKKACFVNAVCQSDLDVFAKASSQSISEGRNIIFRTAASFLNSFASVPQKNLLKKRDIRNKSSNGGLFIVGSYVPKSSAQLDYLLKNSTVEQIEINIEDLLHKKSDFYNISMEISTKIASGNDVVLYTQRKLVSGNSRKENLEIGRKVSEFLVNTIKNISDIPSYILVKGGISSHVVARDALEIKVSKVTGQILPGVPVIKSKKGKFKDVSMIIFPGNVGNDNSLLKIYNELK